MSLTPKLLAYRNKKQDYLNFLQFNKINTRLSLRLKMCVFVALSSSYFFMPLTDAITLTIAGGFIASLLVNPILHKLSPKYKEYDKLKTLLDYQEKLLKESKRQLETEKQSYTDTSTHRLLTEITLDYINLYLGKSVKNLTYSQFNDKFHNKSFIFKEFLQNKGLDPDQLVKDGFLTENIDISEPIEKIYQNPDLMSKVRTIHNMELSAHDRAELNLITQECLPEIENLYKKSLKNSAAQGELSEAVKAIEKRLDNILACHQAAILKEARIHNRFMHHGL